MLCPGACSLSGTDIEAFETAGDAVIGCDIDVDGELVVLDLMAVSAAGGTAAGVVMVGALPGGGGSGAIPMPAASFAAPAAAADL